MVVGLTAVAALGLGTQPASAAVAHQLGDHTICANTVTLHAEPGGKNIGELTRGQHFDIWEIRSDGWVFGWAPDGDFYYVINGFFC